MPRTITPLTDDDLAAIVSADPGTTAVDLARQLGRPYFTVAKAVARIRRAGSWYWRVEWIVCRECGGPLATAPGYYRPVRHQTAACQSAYQARLSRERRAAGLSLSTPYVRAWREKPENAATLAAMREREKAQARGRYHELPPDRQAAILARAHAADARDYPLTLAEASSSGDPWAEDEDAYLLAHLKTPAREVALALGRTLWAVRNRRVRLRRERYHQRKEAAAAPTPTG